MKMLIRTALCAVAGICMSINARACDICGCAIGNNNPYLFPNASRRFVGVAYYHRFYRLQPPHAAHASMRSENLLLNAQVSLGGRFRLQAVLPYIVNRYTSDSRAETKSGLGDLSLLIGYNLLNKKTGATGHLATITAGLKLNTASSTPGLVSSTDALELQTGSGSTDYLVAGTYRLTQANWILLLQGNYRYNTQDKKSGLRFGDAASASVALYRKIPFSLFTLIPYATGSTERRMDDARNHVLTTGSGGHISLAGAGLDLNTRRLAFGISCQVPVSQSLAGGIIREAARFNAHAFFTL
ncbi:transporter [Sediminibacterium soli]|uniref:transporter n=1 Tax=Sediminibacterium soli TaxID=2698829 RepID=UPI001379B8B4|nr:transporter [Sediminibacterium soli]NCI45670.1 transporter [Sediminibacterium soli]